MSNYFLWHYNFFVFVYVFRMILYQYVSRRVCVKMYNTSWSFEQTRMKLSKSTYTRKRMNPIVFGKNPHNITINRSDVSVTVPKYHSSDTFPTSERFLVHDGCKNLNLNISYLP